MPKPAGALRSADATAAAAVLLLGGTLALIGWGFARRWQSTGSHRIIGAEEILGLAAASAGTGLVAWWFLAVAGACAGTVLDRHGRTRAAAVSRKISPAFIQRLAVAALSAQLLTGPAAHAGVTSQATVEVVKIVCARMTRARGAISPPAIRSIPSPSTTPGKRCFCT